MPVANVVEILINIVAMLDCHSKAEARRVPEAAATRRPLSDNVLLTTTDTLSPHCYWHTENSSALKNTKKKRI